MASIYRRCFGVTFSLLIITGISCTQRDGSLPNRAPGSLKAKAANCLKVSGPNLESTDVCYQVVGENYVVEGDILLPALAVTAQAQKVRGANFLADEFRFGFWTNGIVPYTIDASIASRIDSYSKKPFREIIDAAIAEYTRLTKIQFVPRTVETDYVNLTYLPNSRACYSYIGRVGGVQSIQLADGCEVRQTIHELGHTLGMFHEQSRADRDQFVQVNLSNVLPHFLSQFERQLFRANPVGNYDLDSVMQYGPFEFTSNGKPTIAALNGRTDFGKNPTLSPGDIQAIADQYTRYGTPTNSDVAHLYRNVLGRTGSTDDIASWSRFIAQGHSLTELRNVFAHCSESSTNIAALYQAILGRTGLADEINSWQNQLAASFSLEAVRAAIAHSAESQKYIGDTYLAVVGRAANGNELAGDTEYLKVAGHQQAEIRTALAHGAEAAGRVNFLYLAYLNRNADAPGLKSAVDYLAEAGTLAALSHSISHSAEAAGEIAAYYVTLLGRVADSSELTNWQGFLESDHTIGQVQYEIIASSEYKKFHRPPPVMRGEIIHFYAEVLNRPADAVAQFWSDQLDDGRSPAAVRREIAFSAESKGLIAGLYRNLLARQGGDNEIAAWQLHLAVEGHTYMSVYYAFLNSPEYARGHRADVAALYASILERAPDNGGWVGWSGLLNSGTSYQSVRYAIAHSAESEINVRNFYLTLFQREADGSNNSGGLGFWLNYLAGGNTLNDVHLGFLSSLECLELHCH